MEIKSLRKHIQLLSGNKRVALYMLSLYERKTYSLNERGVEFRDEGNDVTISVTDYGMMARYHTGKYRQLTYEDFTRPTCQLKCLPWSEREYWRTKKWI